MIIDFHTHIFPNDIAPKTIPALEQRAGISASTDGMAEGLLHSMENAGADLSVVLPVVTKPSQFESINRFAKMINETYREKLLSFGGIHPDCENYKEKLDFIKELGFPGIKLHPDYQGVMIDDLRYMNIIDYASELDLIIVVHAGVDIGLPKPVHCPPDRMRKVLDAIKPKKLVAAHLGGWRQWEMVYEYLAGESIYFDTAFTFDYIEQELLLKILEKHDKDKVLFATDSPWSGLEKSIRQLYALPLLEEDKKKIFADNARRLLGMEQTKLFE